MKSVFDAAGGEEGLTRLAAAWHERAMADAIVSHAFHQGVRPDHVQRLAAYWIEALGGPPVYSATYADESFVVREHAGNGPHEEMNRLAIACFDEAMTDVGIGDEDPVRQVLHDYFAWATPHVNRFERSPDDVPDGLAIPHWSWEGRDGL